MKRSSAERAAWLALSGLAAALTSASCVWSGVQRWPGPMRATADPLPPGDTSLHRPGPEEVTVIRHADPVQIRPAGALSGRPMEFFDKSAQVTAGGAVIVAPGGRAEVLWPTGASIVILGESVAWIGSPSRGEPSLQFDELERARLDLREGDAVRLLGGALLSGAGGPYVLEHTADGVLSVHNQSKAGVNVAFREEQFELNPNQTVRIPLLSSGGAPFSDDPALRRVDGEGVTVRLAGPLECRDEGGALEVSAPAGAEGHVRGLGVRVDVAPGARVRFKALPIREPAAPASAPASADAPAPSSTAP